MPKKESIRQAEADKKHAIRVSLKFNKNFDYEILKWLNEQPNKQGAIKDAILFYIYNKDDFE